MPLRVFRVVIALPAREEFRALGNGFGDEGLEAGEGVCGDHGADVDVRVCEGRTQAEGLDAGFEEGD